MAITSQIRKVHSIACLNKNFLVSQLKIRGNIYFNIVAETLKSSQTTQLRRFFEISFPLNNRYVITYLTRRRYVVFSADFISIICKI